MGREAPLVLGMMESETQKDKQTNKTRRLTTIRKRCLNGSPLSNKIVGTFSLLD